MIMVSLQLERCPSSRVVTVIGGSNVSLLEVVSLFGRGCIVRIRTLCLLVSLCLDLKLRVKSSK